MQRQSTSTDAMRSYLQEIGRIPMLTRDQEIQLGKQVQQLVHLLEIQASLTENLGHPPTVAEWADAAGLSTHNLTKAVRAGERAKHRMVTANLRLVVSIAKNYVKRDMELIDLVQEGSMGLIRGVEKFDPTKGYRFSTYAYWWIRQAITRAIAEKSRVIRLPIHITEKLNKIKKAQQKLSQNLRRTPHPTEIGEAIGLSDDEVQHCLELSRKTISLDMRVGDQEDTELLDILQDDGISPDEYAEGMLQWQDVYHWLAELTPQQREVIHLRYGLGNGHQLSLSKIGAQLNVSRERVRQIEQKAIHRLRQRHGKPSPLATGVQ